MIFQTQHVTNGSLIKSVPVAQLWYFSFENLSLVPTVNLISPYWDTFDRIKLTQAIGKVGEFTWANVKIYPIVVPQEGDQNINTTNIRGNEEDENPWMYRGSPIPMCSLTPRWLGRDDLPKERQWWVNTFHYGDKITDRCKDLILKTFMEELEKAITPENLKAMKKAAIKKVLNYAEKDVSLFRCQLDDLEEDITMELKDLDQEDE